MNSAPNESPSPAPILHLQRIGWWERWLASLLDGLILCCCLLPVLYLKGDWLMDFVRGGNSDVASIGYRTQIVTTVLILTYSVFEMCTGASPGAKIIGIRIKNSDSEPANSNQLILRWFAKNLNCGIKLIGAAIGIQAIFWVGKVVGTVMIIGMFLVLTKDRQTLHDKIAGTSVFRI